MIGNLPLWMVITLWFLQRRNAPRVSIFNYSKWMSFLMDVRTMLPLPTSRLEEWMLTEINVALDAEISRVETLVDWGVLASGVMVWE